MQGKACCRLLTLISILSCPFFSQVMAGDLDLSSLLPSRWYWFVYITPAHRMQLIALMQTEHGEPESGQGSVLHFYSLPQTVHSLWPTASSIINANWHQHPPCSIQMSQENLFTTYSFSQAGERRVVEAAGRSNCERALTSGAVNLRSVLQLLGIGCAARFNRPVGVVMYALWHAWYYLMAPHSSLTVFRWILASHNRRNEAFPEPPFSIPPPHLKLGFNLASDITLFPMGGVRTGLTQPWQALASGVAHPVAPSTPVQIINEAASGSVAGGVGRMVNGAHTLCGGLRHFAIRGRGNALIWECPYTLWRMQPFHGGYLGLISHQVMMRTLFFRGTREEQQRLDRSEPDFLNKKDKE